MKNIALNRQLLGVEDLLLGIGVLEQTRGGVKVNITKLNALNIPFDDVKTIADILNEKLDITSYTAQSILAKLLTIDGHTSGLDADLLDGHEGSWYQQLLESGVNIKTLNGLPLLGSGDFQLTIGSGGYAANVYLTNLTSTTNASYKQLSYSPDVAEVILNGTANNNDVLIYSSIFDGDVKATGIPSGEWGFHFHRKVDNIAQLSRLRFDIYKRSSAGVETVLFSTYSNDINDTTYVREDLLITQPSYTVVYTDRIGLKVYASTTRTSNTIISFKIGDGEASFINTPLQLRHNQLRDRDEVDAHPISAITGLQTSLDSKVNLGSATSNTMTKAQFNALAEERKANRAGSGFDEFGKHVGTSINEGMYTNPIYINNFRIGGPIDGTGTSKKNNPVVNINGVVQNINYINTTINYDNTILLPTAPNIYPYDTVLTTEQINSGVIKHADASNSGLIVNGKFDTDTSGWVFSDSNAVFYENNSIRITSTSADRRIRQSISCIIGKKYIIEAEMTSTDIYGGFIVGLGTTFSAEIQLRVGRIITNKEKVKFEFTATSTMHSIQPIMGAANSTVTFDNIAVYPVDAVSRSDLAFLESWHEYISEKNFVYPLGNVQYLGGNTDGLTGIANGAFTGFETYSLFGNWQTPSALIGKGYVWSSLTEAQKKAFIANPENNCYLDGDKVIQVRYRVRVVQGLGDNWTQMSNLAIRISGDDQSALLYSSASNYIRAIGKNTVPIDYSAAAPFFTFAFPTSNRNLGTYSTGVSNTSTAYEGKCYALPIALVHRRNQGMYHPVYNANGTKKAADGNFWYNTTETFTSISDCFNPAKLLVASGYIGSISGRPDGLFYDQVHESDILDLRNSSKKVEDYNRLINREFNKLVAGTYRGKEGEYQISKYITNFTVDVKGFIGYSNTAVRLVDNGNNILGGVYDIGSSSAYSYIGFISSNTVWYKIGVISSGTNSIVILSPEYGDVSSNFTVGNTYSVIACPQTTRTKSNTLLHCDIIGNPTNYPAAWKEIGVFGTPLIVAEDGTRLIPNGVLDTFKLSRKANATPLLCLRSTDSGVTWTSFTPTFSTTTNAITLTDEPAANLVMVYYQTHTNMAVPVVNNEVLEIGDVCGAGAIASVERGGYLCDTLINKQSIGNNAPHQTIRKNINSVVYRDDLLNSTLNSLSPNTFHENIFDGYNVLPTPAVKVFPYLTRKNGKAYLNLVFKEMKHNGTSWGDDSKFNIVDNVSTTTDTNAATVLIGQKTVELPYFIGADE